MVNRIFNMVGDAKPAFNERGRMAPRQAPLGTACRRAGRDHFFQNELEIRQQKQ
jgi:hypothetical protein